MAAFYAPNTITREIAPKSWFEDASNVVAATLTCNQGDFLYLDTSTHTIKKLVTETDSATCLGISRVALSSGKLISPYQGTAVDAAAALKGIPGPVYGVIAKVVLKSGDTVTNGAALYADVANGAQNVTTTVGTNVVGIYQGLQGASVTGVSGGTIIEVLIGSAWNLAVIAI